MSKLSTKADDQILAVAEATPRPVESELTILQRETTIIELGNRLSARELTYSHLFLQMLNKTRVCLEMGYSPTCASAQGVEIYNRPHVNEYIKALIKDAIGTPDENIKAIKAIAETDLKQYLSPVARVRSDTVQRPVTEIIKDLQRELDIENAYYIEYADTKLERTVVLQNIANLKKRIGVYNLKLRYDPDATDFVQGPEYLAMEMELDIVKIHADKEHGQIKGLRTTKDGIQIELCNPLEARNLLGKIHGSYEKDNKRVISFDFENADVVFK